MAPCGNSHMAAILLLSYFLTSVAANSVPAKGNELLLGVKSVSDLLTNLLRDRSLMGNLTGTSGIAHPDNLNLTLPALDNMLAHLLNGSKFLPGNWTGLARVNGLNRTGRGESYGGSSYGGWGGGGGGYGGGGYGGGGYGNNDNGLLLALLLRGRDHGPPPQQQQQQQQQSSSNLGPLALLSLLALALISRMPTQ